MKKIYVALIALTLAGCAEDRQMVLDLTGSYDRWSFYNQGFPTDLKTNLAGKVDFSDFPRARQSLIAQYVNESRDTVSGYAPESPIYLRFKGDYRPSDFVLPQSPDATLTSSSSIQLINIDPDSPDLGKRHPIEVNFQYTEDNYRPAGLLSARPVGEFLSEDTTYALIVTRSVSPDYADDLTPNPILSALLKGSDPKQVDRLINSKKAAKALKLYAPLADQLVRDRISLNNVIAATVWTTGTPTNTARRIAQAASSWPIAPLTTEWRLTQDRDNFCVLKADWQVPGLQKGTTPYPISALGGDIRYDASGAPIVQYDRPVSVVVTVPKTAMPVSGYPILHYHHGIQGDADQVWSRGKTLADGTLTEYGNVSSVAALRGWATSGMDGHLAAAHQAQQPFVNWVFEGIQQPLNLIQYNFVNPKAMRDNLMQQMSERIMVRRLLKTAQIDTSLCPGASAPSSDSFFFDSNLEAIGGQSLGSFTAIAQVANDSESVKALIPTGAGVYDVDLILQNASLSAANEPLGKSLEKPLFGAQPGEIIDDPMHPFYAIASHVLAPANTGYMIARHLRETAERPNILTVFGHVDDWVPLRSQAPLLRAMRLDMAGLELDVTQDLSLLKVVEQVGAGQQFFPVQANSADGSTAAFVRYAEDGIMSGHHVFYQYSAPKHQIGCLLQDISSGLTPTIVSGSAIDGACASGSSQLVERSAEPF